MKKAIAFAIVVTSLLFISPFFIAQQYENKYHYILDKANEHPNVSVTKRSYQADWFSGQSSTTFSFTDLSLNNDIEITINDNLNFGPVVFTEQGVDVMLVQSTSALEAKGGALGAELVKKINEHIELVGSINLLGNYNILLNTKAFTVNEHDRKFSFGALSGEMDILNELSVIGNFTWDGISITSPEVTVDVSDMTFLVDQEVLSGNIYRLGGLADGTTHFTIEKVDFADNTSSTKISMTQFEMSSLAQTTNELMDISVDYSIGSMYTPLGEYDNAKLAILISKLNVELLQELSDTVTAFTQHDSKQPIETNIEMLIPIVIELLDNEPMLNVTDLSFNTPQGRIESNMLLALDTALVNQQNLASLIQAAKVDGQASVPDEFLASIGVKPMTDSFVEQGFAVREEANVTTNFILAKGLLSLNGKPLAM